MMVIGCIKAFATLWAMTIIGLLEKVALDAGIDGILLITVIAVIAGLGGYEASNLVKLIKTNKLPIGKS